MSNPARVLLVEDNVNNRKIVEIMLLRLCIEHAIAEDGDAAVSAYEAADYDLILMDIQMSNMQWAGSIAEDSRDGRKSRTNTHAYYGRDGQRIAGRPKRV